jgi:hypothetical protein
MSVDSQFKSELYEADAANSVDSNLVGTFDANQNGHSARHEQHKRYIEEVAAMLADQGPGT